MILTVNLRMSDFLKKFCLDILSDQNHIVQTNVNFGRKMSDVRPLFQALIDYLKGAKIDGKFLFVVCSGFI